MTDAPKFQQQDFINIIMPNGTIRQLACARWTDGDHRCYFHGHSFIGGKKDIAAKVQEVIAAQDKAGYYEPQTHPSANEEPHYVEALSNEPRAVLAERAMKEAWKAAALALDRCVCPSCQRQKQIQAGPLLDRARELEAKDDWFPRATRKLDSLNFEGVNPVSYMSAAELLGLLDKCNLKPGRIVRTAEGHISFWFSDGEVKVRVEACEDGEFVISTLGLNSTHTEYKTAAEVMAELTRDPQRI